MADIRPFKAVRYNPEKVKGEDVTAPPYDIVSPDFKDKLYARSPFNIIRIDYGKDQEGDAGDINRYSRARDYLHRWLDERVLIRDNEDSLYRYEIDYQIKGTNLRLSGLLALLKLEELGRGIFPHEATHSKPKADRLNLMKACLGNISPIFALYRGAPIAKKDAIEQLFESKDNDGAIHRLYRHSEDAYIHSVLKELNDKDIFIADGHHRYEVALEFSRLARNGQIEGLSSNIGYKPWEYVLTYIVNINDSDLTILPTHRLIKTVPGGGDVTSLLSRHFNLSAIEYSGNEQDIISTLSESGKNSIGLYMGGNHWHLLSYKQNALQELAPQLQGIDTVILQELILKQDLRTEDIVYEMDLKKALSLTGNGNFKALFILNPTEIGEVEGVAQAGLRMPPKSTYFYPKLLTGMAIHTFF